MKDLHSALDQYSKAKAIITEDLSHYLLEKKKRVEKRIHTFRTETFVVTADEITPEGPGLKELGNKLQAWAIERAWEKAKGRKTVVAKTT